ncbi:hypothetical protein F934_01275 [Acinetobacter beijerinckii ANC 3835]|uniref:Uncharacterized protein n=1 Tax=Acinetobacter beijerinckii ANC 3835 TaxID=1217649 RepID=N9FDD8_9GAMM|nr:hypothetical protein F934_01275 [Acinetobacter beijerinckii ANC 3835]
MFDFDHACLVAEHTIESQDQTKLRYFLDLLMLDYKRTNRLYDIFLVVDLFI